jgi:hypothetical protein
MFAALMIQKLDFSLFSSRLYDAHHLVVPLNLSFASAGSPAAAMVQARPPKQQTSSPMLVMWQIWQSSLPPPLMLRFIAPAKGGD